MTSTKTGRMVQLHERADRHRKSCKRLMGDRSVQSRDLHHSTKAERLYSQVASIIPDFAPDAA